MRESFSHLTTGNSQHVGSSAFASWASSLEFTWLDEPMTNWRFSLNFESPHLKEEQEKESHIALMLRNSFLM
jgi:hypothetical protein